MVRASPTALAGSIIPDPLPSLPLYPVLSFSEAFLFLCPLWQGEGRECSHPWGLVGRLLCSSRLAALYDILCWQAEGLKYSWVLTRTRGTGLGFTVAVAT